MTSAEARARGREWFDRRAWADAVAELSAADREAPLEPEDLERLATAAYLIGRDEDSVEVWERAHHELLSRGDTQRAARCAGWIVFVLMNTGEFARGGGWLARAHRLIDDGQDDCAERGHLLVPVAFQHAFAGDWPNGPRDLHPGRRDRRSVRGHRPGDARPQYSGPGADRAGKDRRGNGPARRGHGRGDGGRGVRDRRRCRLLQRDRGVPGGLRSASGAAVDGGADPLVRLPAGSRPVQRQLPRASRRDHAAARRVAGRRRRCAAGVRAAHPAGSAGGRCRLLPAGRAAPAARRVLAGRGGVPPGQPMGARAAARSSAATTGPGAGRRRGGGDPSRGRRGPGPGDAVAVASRARRDHVCRR